jgi:hypothetical protein
MQRPLKYHIRDTLYKPLYKLQYNWSSKSHSSTSRPLTSPVIITGIYRSGTTLCSTIIEKIGVDLGPESHKCGGVGNFRNLNSEGFQENFLVNDLGRYILYINGGSGIDFPNINILSNFSLEKIDDSDFAYYSEKFVNDDRVFPHIRKTILRNYGISGINQYFYNHFDTRSWGFKDVHSGVFLPVYEKFWPGCKFVCVFRKPCAFLRSALALNDKVTLQTWLDYYNRVSQFEDEVNLFWLPYEEVLNKNEELIKKLVKFITGSGSIDNVDIKALLQPVRTPVRKTQNLDDEEMKELNREAYELYKELLNKSFSISKSKL